jgi:hypothetical protein
VSWYVAMHHPELGLTLVGKYDDDEDRARSAFDAGMKQAKDGGTWPDAYRSIVTEAESVDVVIGESWSCFPDGATVAVMGNGHWLDVLTEAEGRRAVRAAPPRQPARRRRGSKGIAGSSGRRPA